MTSYAAIADSDVDPESPGNTTLFTRLRDNPLAIQENDATAPDVVGASLVKIATATASASTNIPFTGLDNTYATYILVGEDILPSDTTSITLEIQVSDDNGSTYKTTGYDAISTLMTSTGNAHSFDETATSMWVATPNLHTTIPSGFTARLSGIGENVRPKASVTSFGQITGGAGGAYIFKEELISQYDTSITTDAIRIQFSGANITSGTFKLYGLRAV